MKRAILVPSAIELPAERLLDAALMIAERIDGDVHEMFVRPDIAAVLDYLPDTILAAGISKETIEQETAEAASASQARFEKWRARNNIVNPSGPAHEHVSAHWSVRVGDLEAMVTRFGRISDFVIVSRPTLESTQAQRCFDAAVFGSGRPTLVVGGELPYGFAEHIMIAWNGSLEASRAIAGAMPLLEHAKRISILTALEHDMDDIDLAELAEVFALRGLYTPEVIFPTHGRSAGAELVEAARKQKATLIVMGAYTHSRIRQTFLGGVTKHLLSHAPVPLLMCH
jgi:nucleotide-binding universal stress UspA family protein